MAESYLGRLQSMFSDPTANRPAPRPVSGPMTPMQQQQAITRPNFQTVGAPQQVGGEMRNFRPAAPNFTMPGPSYPSPATMSYPTPATAGPSGLAPQMGGGGTRFMGTVTDVTPRPPAPAAVAPAAPAAGGFFGRLLGGAGRLATNPLVGLASLATMLPWEQQAQAGRDNQQAMLDDLLGNTSAPAPMPTPEMAMNAAPPPMSTAMAPSMAAQIPSPMNPAPMAQAPAMAPAAAPAMAPAPAPMPAPVAAPAYTPPGGVWEGQNQGIQDDTRARAMAWLALQQGMR